MGKGQGALVLGIEICTNFVDLKAFFWEGNLPLSHSSENPQLSATINWFFFDGAPFFWITFLLVRPSICLALSFTAQK